MTTAFSIASLFAYSSKVRWIFATPKLAVLMVGALLIVPMLLMDWREVLRKPLLIPGLTVLFAWVLSASLSGNPTWCFIGRPNGFSSGVLAVFLALIYYLAADRDICKTITAAGVVLGLHALAQRAGIDAAWLDITGGRSISTIGNPVFLGEALILCLPFALSRSWVYGLAVALGIASTESRGAMLGAAAGLVVWRFR